MSSNCERYVFMVWFLMVGWMVWLAGWYSETFLADILSFRQVSWDGNKNIT